MRAICTCRNSCTTYTHTSYLQAARDQALTKCSQKTQEISQLEELVASHVQTIAEFKAKDIQNETVRRKLHNTIQELKGERGTT